MGWIKERSTAFDAAWGPRRYMLMPLTGAVIGFVDWVITMLAEAGMGSLIGIPSWAVGLYGATLLGAWWLLECIVKLRRELAPKINVAFEPEKGGVSLTTLTRNGEYVDDCKYIRLAVTNTSSKSVAECVANLVKIERRLDLARTETIWDQDSLPLTWGMTGGFDSKIHYLAKRFVDVACIQKQKCQIKLLTIVPNRLAPNLPVKGTLILTIVVTGDGISKEGKIEVEMDGTFDGLKARPI